MKSTFLDEIFDELPKTTIAAIALLRFMVAVPLFQAALQHMEFVRIEILLYVMAALSVISLETIGFLASILTANFRTKGIRAGFYVALSIALVVAGFNAYLIQYNGIAIDTTALIMFHFFNVVSVGLGEAIGFLVSSTSSEVSSEVSSVRNEVSSAPSEVSDTDTPTRMSVDEWASAYRIPKQATHEATEASKVFTNPLLGEPYTPTLNNSTIPITVEPNPRERVTIAQVQELQAQGLNNTQIAQELGCSARTVTRKLNALKSE